jgi:hypothetical protein
MLFLDNVGSPDPNGNGEVLITWSSAPAPAVTAVTPNSGPSTGGTVVTITGTHFAGATTVMFGASPATNLTISDTAITATAPPGAAGPVDITVTTPAGTSAAGPADQFTYLVPTPVVTAISPASGPEAGGTQVTISGSHFTGATTVSFGATSATAAIVNSDTSITATAPSDTDGIVDVTVTGPSGTSTAVTADHYTYLEPAPAITSVSPASGPETGGTAVTISGTDFLGASAVHFGSASAAGFTVNGDTSITATARRPPLSVRSTSP